MNQTSKNQAAMRLLSLNKAMRAMALVGLAALGAPVAHAACPMPAGGTVTGSISGGTVWGNNADGYTTDSDLARAATHAGLVAPGASAAIAVTSLETLPSFTGTAANGIITNSYPSPWCGMRLSAAGSAPAPAPAPGPAPAPPPGMATGQRSSAYEYDAVTGLLKAEIVEPDIPDQCVRTAYTLDKYGNRTMVTVSPCTGASDAAKFNGRSTSASYADPNYPVVMTGAYPDTVTNALGHAETRMYNVRNGALKNQIGPNGLSTNWEFDDFGRQVLEQSHDNNKVVTRYCLLPAKVSDTSSNSDGCTTPANTPADALSYVETFAQDPTGAQSSPGTRKYMDVLGRVIREEMEAYDGDAQPGNARMILKDTEYNDWGAVAKVTQPYFAGSGTSIAAAGAQAYGWTATSYDALGRPVSVLVRDNEGSGTYNGQTVAEASFAYNALIVTETRLRTSKNAQGQQQAGVNLTTTRTSNPLGQVVQVVDGLGNSLTKRYDAYGNVVETRDAQDNRVVTSFDTRGRKTQLADPNAGIWNYRYNALGELTGQQSPQQAVGNTWTTLAYDVLGRLIQRNEPEYNTTWSYDRYADNSDCNRGVGKLCETNTSHGVNRRNSYDSLGRLINVTQSVQSGPSYTASQNYTPAGKVRSATWPTGITIDNLYTPLGYLREKQIYGATIWSLKAQNAWGQPERYDLGGAAQATKVAYDPVTGRTAGINVGTGDTGTEIERQSYGWDTVGNLTDRADNYDGTNSVTENFAYDALNRLSGYQVSSPGIAGLARDVAITYDAIGNITSKSDVGTYNYPASGAGSVRPGAVSSISPATGLPARSYAYDPAGNMTSSSGGGYTTLAYTSFNLPSSLAGGSATYAWQYGPDHERVKETKGNRTTWYFHPDNQNGLAFEQEVKPGSIINRHYVSVMGRTVHMFETTGEGGQNVTSTQWWHADHLGSTVAITNQSFAVTQRMSYDPFGKRRQINGSYDAFGSLVYDYPNGTDRGFTGHEHLDDVGVVHMNGRTFDPHIGRFMQADPIIQLPDNGQSYNRYSYVLNNPLNATDPSGHAIAGIIPAGILVARALGFIDTKTTRQLLGLVVTVAIAGADGGAFGAGGAGGFEAAKFVQSVIAGMAGGAVSCGVECAALGGMSAMSAFAVGDVAQMAKMPEGGFGHSMLHAVSGCVTASAAGGNCGHGAASNFFANYIGSNKTLSDALGPLGARMIVGGTTSVIGGGKFANGATSGAFIYLFNDLQHADGWDSKTGRGPNMRGLDAEGVARARLEAEGYKFQGRQVAASDGTQVRVYDLLMVGPDGGNVAVEVKSTIGDILKLNQQQVKFDAQVYERGASVLTNSGTVVTVRQVMYIGVDFGSSAAAAFSSFRLKQILESSGATTKIYRSGRP